MNQSDADLVTAALQAVSDLDIVRARSLVADDLILELPFRSGGLPTVLVGDDAHRFMRLMPKVFTRMDFFDVVIHGAGPTGVIAAEYKSNGKTKAGKSYRNVYAAFFEVRDGRITRWREYFNPDVIAEALT